MNNIKYEIKFYTDWHCGSGQTSGADVDSLVIKDETGLPYIPGKTLKGLIRDIAEDLSMYGYPNMNQFIKECFGHGSDKTEESYATQLYFSNAHNSRKFNQDLSTKKELKKYLYRKISSTAINSETGIAENKSLRKIEVCIPMSLYAEIKNIPDEHIQTMEKCLKMVKNIGMNRNRGLGRCDIRIYEKEA